LAGFDLIESNAGPKTEKSRINKDKLKRRYHQDVTSGKRTKAPHKKSLDNFKNGVSEAKKDVTLSLLRKEFDTKQHCSVYEVGKQTKLLQNQNLHAGLRAFQCLDKEVNLGVNSEGVNKSGYMKAKSGWNIIDLQNDEGSARMQVNGPNGEVDIGGDITIDQVQTNLATKLKAKAVILDARADYHVTYCTQNNCLETTINPSIGIGVGIEAGVGYDTYKNKPGGSATMLFGLGAGAMAGMEVNMSIYQPSK